MRVKVCGITRVADALHAEACGAYAIGVVMCSESARTVSKARAEQIFSALRPSTLKVAVTDTASGDDIGEILSLHPDAIQVSHPFMFRQDRPFRIFRVVKRGEMVPENDTDFIVVDESRGSGREFDRTFARDIVRRSRVSVVLAGGLNPGNVREAVSQVRPAMVDVSSGVEVSPGIKDEKKVQEFLACCREL
jgi:phosphoribosylanthranilate isomerase